MKRDEALQHLQQVHASLLAHGWTLQDSESETDDDEWHELRSYVGSAQLQTDGSGIWGATAGLQVTATCITLAYNGDDEYGSWHVGVEHDFDENRLGERECGLRAKLYTDRGMEAGVSELLGTQVSFTESGMQDEFYMSME